MLNQITTPRPAKQPPEDALDLLTGCHQRIRYFTAAAIKLAHAQGASPEDIRQAAAGVHRYYSVSLPLHEADEELTLRPRLDAVGSERVRHALAAMHDQHQAIDELIERLLPLLMLVERNPDTLPDVGHRDVFDYQGPGRSIQRALAARRGSDFPFYPRIVV